MIQRLSFAILITAALCIAPAMAQDSAPEAESKPRKTRTTKPRATSPAKAEAQAEADAGSLEDDTPKPAARKVRITRSRTAQTTAPAAPGWTALASGDLALAKTEFENTLRTEPRNADALIGLAHIAARQNQPALAASLALRAVELHPRHPQAQALALTLAAAADPLGSESAAKNILAAHPDCAGAHFLLGTLMARGTRWQEAQDAFFRAWTLEPDNADYQYNLAVSLDHLNQAPLALDHYQAALHAATTRAAAFDPAALKARINQLAPKP